MLKTARRTLTILVLLLLTPLYASADGRLMTTDQLKSKLGNSDIVILDARGSWDWVKANDKISGAKRVDPGSVSIWAKDLEKEKTIVVYCA